MSPRWRDRLTVALSPGEVSCALQPRGWRSPPPRRTQLSCQPAADGPPWRTAVEALREALPQLAPRRTDVEIVLSNHFVRFLVVPWHHALARREEREALARLMFRDTYAELADGWHVRLSGCAYGDAELACAIDSGLLQALSSLGAGNARLTRVEPLLAIAFNAFLREFADDACLCVTEPGRLCFGHLTGGQWQRVHSVRVSATEPVDTLVGRQLQVLGVDPDVAVFVFDAADPLAVIRTGGRERPKPASHHARSGMRLFAMVL